MIIHLGAIKRSVAELKHRPVVVDVYLKSEKPFDPGIFDVAEECYDRFDRMDNVSIPREDINTRRKA